MTETAQTFPHAFDQPLALGHGCFWVFDPVRDPQLLSDRRVSEQSHLKQREAVGGGPVGEHGLGGDTGSNTDGAEGDGSRFNMVINQPWGS